MLITNIGNSSNAGYYYRWGSAAAVCVLRRRALARPFMLVRMHVYNHHHYHHWPSYTHRICHACFLQLHIGTRTNTHTHTHMHIYCICFVCVFILFVFFVLFILFIQCFFLFCSFLIISLLSSFQHTPCQPSFSIRLSNRPRTTRHSVLSH
jgi:hypothetical protein